METILIEMIQGLDERDRLITHVSRDYMFRKYNFQRFIPYGEVKKPVARFVIKYRLPKKRFWENNNDYVKRIEDKLHYHLEIFNCAVGANCWPAKGWHKG